MNRRPEPVFFLSTLLTVGALLFSGCEYAPTGTSYEAKSIPLPEVTLELNDEADSLYAWGRTELHYDLDLEDRTLFEGNLWIDDHRFYVFDRLEGTIAFYSDEYDDGHHILTMQAYTSSGSESLADVSGEEVFLFERSWDLFIDNGPPQPIHIESISTVEGQLKLTWEPFLRDDFVRYAIESGSLNSNGEIDHHPLYSESNRSENTYIDTNYIGGEIFYRVNLMVDSGPVQGSWRRFEGPGSGFIDLTEGPNNSISLTWSACHYPSNLLEYRIKRDAITLFTSDQVDDTTFTDIDPSFGKPQNYYLQVLPKGDNGSQYIIRDTLAFILGEQVPVSGSMQIAGGLESFYEKHGSTIYRYDETTLQAMDSMSYESVVNFFQFGISPDGQYAYVMTFYNDIGHLHRIDPIHLNILESWTTQSLLGYNGRTGQSLSVSNTNVLAFASYVYLNFTNWGMGVVVLDMESPSEVVNPNHEYGTSALISPNGNYVIAYDSLYAFEDHSLRVIGGWEHYLPRLFIGDGDQVVICGNTFADLRNSADLSLVAQIATLERLQDPSYDPSTGYIGGTLRTRDRYKVFHFETSSLIRDISCSVVYQGRLWDHQLYLGGYRLNLSQGRH